METKAHDLSDARDNIHPSMPTTSAFRKLSEEVNQEHSTRQPLYIGIEKELGGSVFALAYFTSFTWPVIISDQDADMIEEALRNADLDGKELILILNSPGGDGLAAERIVNICRSHSKLGFSVIVPKKAKSAATMICFGANRILMSKTSELGPIDPQIPVYENGRVTDYKAAHEIVESYQELMEQASKTKGRIEPFLQQLARFDARDIRKIKSAQQLAESIALKSLKAGVLARVAQASIRKKIMPFLDPKQTKVHGRPIYHDVAAQCGLNVQLQELHSPLWQHVWNLYIRLNYLTTFNVSKVIESANSVLTAPIPEGVGQ